MMRFDRFTEKAQDAAQRAVDILQRYGQNQIDTEHFLLALIEQPEGIVSEILDEMNISTATLSDRLDYMLRTTTMAAVPDRFLLPPMFAGSWTRPILKPTG